MGKKPKRMSETKKNELLDYGMDRMDLNITKKYAKEFFKKKVQKHFITTKTGIYFSGAIKFEFTDCMKKIRISLWLPGATSPIFVFKEKPNFYGGSIFTFEPISLKMNFRNEDTE